MAFGSSPKIPVRPVEPYATVRQATRRQPTPRHAKRLTVDARDVSLTFQTARRRGRGAVQRRACRSATAISSRLSGRRAAARPRCCASSPTCSGPRSGTILINGMTPEQARLARHYGYIFQAPALYPWRTIERNVALPLEIMGFDAHERRKRVERYLKLVNLSGFERKFPWQLLRRHAAAGLDRARAVVRSGAAADGRAVRRARRDRPRPSQRATAAALGTDRKDRASSSPIRFPKRCFCPPGSW